MVELVYLLSDRGLHCLPVVDEQQRLVGMYNRKGDEVTPFLKLPAVLILTSRDDGE